MPLLHHEIERLMMMLTERDQLINQFRSDLAQQQVVERRLNRELAVARSQAITALNHEQQLRDAHKAETSSSSFNRAAVARGKSPSPAPPLGPDETYTARRLRLEREQAIAIFDVEAMQEQLTIAQAELHRALVAAEAGHSELVAMRSDKAHVEAQMTLLEAQLAQEREKVAGSDKELARFKEQSRKDMFELKKSLEATKKALALASRKASTSSFVSPTAARAATSSTGAAGATIIKAAETSTATSAEVAEMVSEAAATEKILAEANELVVLTAEVEIQTEISGARAEEFFGDFGGGSEHQFGFGGSGTNAVNNYNTMTLLRSGGAPQPLSSASSSLAATPGNKQVGSNSNNNNSCNVDLDFITSPNGTRVPSPQRIDAVQGKLGQLELHIEGVEQQLRATLDMHLQNRNRMSVQRQQRQQQLRERERKLAEDEARRQREEAEAIAARRAAGDLREQDEFLLPPSSHQRIMIAKQQHSGNSGSNTAAGGDHDDAAERALDAQDKEIEAKLRRLREQLQISNPNYKPLSQESTEFLSSSRAFRPSSSSSSATSFTSPSNSLLLPQEQQQHQQQSPNYHAAAAGAASPYERFLEAQKRKAALTAQEARRGAEEMSIADMQHFVTMRFHLAQEMTMRREAEERQALLCSAHAWALRIDTAHRTELQHEVHAYENHNRDLMSDNDVLEREKIDVARQLHEERQRGIELGKQLGQCRLMIQELTAELDSMRHLNRTLALADLGLVEQERRVVLMQSEGLGRAVACRETMARGLSLAALFLDEQRLRIDAVQDESEGRTAMWRALVDDRRVTMQEHVAAEMLLAMSRGRAPVVVPPSKRQLDALQKELDVTKDALAEANFASQRLQRQAAQTTTLVTFELMQCLLDRFTNLTGAREQNSALVLEKKRALFHLLKSAFAGGAAVSVASRIPTLQFRPSIDGAMDRKQSPSAAAAAASAVTSPNISPRSFLFSSPQEKHEAVARRSSPPSSQPQHHGDAAESASRARSTASRSPSLAGAQPPRLPRFVVDDEDAHLLMLNARYTVLVDGVMARLYDKFSDFQWRLALAFIETVGTAKVEKALSELDAAVKMFEQQVASSRVSSASASVSSTRQPSPSPTKISAADKNQQEQQQNDRARSFSL